VWTCRTLWVVRDRGVGVGRAPLRRLSEAHAALMDPIRVGLTARLPVIDGRLEDRSRTQVERGLVAETEAALSGRSSGHAPVLTGIGYAQALAQHPRELTMDELPVAMAQPTVNTPAAAPMVAPDSRVRWFEIERGSEAAILNYLKESI